MKEKCRFDKFFYFTILHIFPKLNISLQNHHNNRTAAKIIDTNPNLPKITESAELVDVVAV